MVSLFYNRKYHSIHSFHSVIIVLYEPFSQTAMMHSIVINIVDLAKMFIFSFFLMSCTFIRLFFVLYYLSTEFLEKLKVLCECF